MKLFLPLFALFLGSAIHAAQHVMEKEKTGNRELKEEFLLGIFGAAVGVGAAISGITGAIRKRRENRQHRELLNQIKAQETQDLAMEAAAIQSETERMNAEASAQKALDDQEHEEKKLALQSDFDSQMLKAEEEYRRQLQALEIKMKTDPSVKVTADDIIQIRSNAYEKYNVTAEQEPKVGCSRRLQVEYYDY